MNMTNNRMHPCAVTYRKGITKEVPLGNALVRTKREKKKKRALSNNHNVMLGCVIQKKSFSLGGGPRDLS